MQRKLMTSERGFYIAERQSCEHTWKKCSGYFRSHDRAKRALQNQRQQKRTNSRSWRAVMYALEAHPNLQEYAKQPFVDREKGLIDKKKLLDATKGMPSNEKQLVHIIVRLYDVQRLDQEHQRIAKEATRICFGLLS
ncbi:hypothetical protein [Brevibacillus sp. SYSU BS000544]|uniref:hypothetical protein n=1 Tax=Brevibacillus sp. SYSU BS000544 TaxID=3416443 RepID=UPI003CE5C918